MFCVLILLENEKKKLAKETGLTETGTKVGMMLFTRGKMSA